MYSKLGKNYWCKEEFSLFGSLQGGSRTYSPQNQCYCKDPQFVNNNQDGKCYPLQLCGNCDLDKSGLCSQDSGPTGVAGV